MFKNRVVIKSFKKELLKKGVDILIKEILKNKFQFSKPIYLPNTIEKFTILISPHVDKNAREQYEIKTFTCFLDIYENYDNVQQLILVLDAVSGIEVNIKDI